MGSCSWNPPPKTRMLPGLGAQKAEQETPGQGSSCASSSFPSLLKTDVRSLASQCNETLYLLAEHGRMASQLARVHGLNGADTQPAGCHCCRPRACGPALLSYFIFISALSLSVLEEISISIYSALSIKAQAAGESFCKRKRREKKKTTGPCIRCLHASSKRWCVLMEWGLWRGTSNTGLQANAGSHYF